MKSDPKKQIALRLSPELHKNLEEWAREEGRSVNAQIEYLLTQAVLNREKR